MQWYAGAMRSEASIAKHKEYSRIYGKAHWEKKKQITYEWRKLNPTRWKELKRESAKRVYDETRGKVLDFLGRTCAHCGIEDELVLCIDHINNNGSVDRRRFRSLTYLRYILALGEMAKDEYQILCANCNMRKYRVKCHS